MRGWYLVPAMFQKLPYGRHPDRALAIARLAGEDNPNNRALRACIVGSALAGWPGFKRCAGWPVGGLWFWTAGQLPCPASSLRC